jgi:GTP-binding protein
VLKGKQLTNIRTTSKDEAVRLTPPIRMTLEKALAYIEDDELVEVTPKSIRLRKKHLDPNERKRRAEACAVVAQVPLRRHCARSHSRVQLIVG